MPQSASMTALWHPAIRADWLVLRRTGAVAFARVIGAPVLLLVCCAAVACGDFYGGYGWCLAAGALLALAGSHAIAHRRLLAAAQRWRFGWCGAMPAARAAATSTLLLVSLGALIASLAFTTALLFAVSASAPHRADLVYAVAGIDLALVVGVAIAAARALRRSPQQYRADGIREPLLALPWLNDPRLPHLLDWQRRATLVRWRSGGNFILVGVVLAGVPQGPVLHQVVGLVLIALSLTWLAVAMGACADSTLDATRLMAGTPFDPQRVRRAALRYPAIGACAAAVLAAIGVALAAPSSAWWCGWAACACAESVWPVRRLLNATRVQGAGT
jgi:hypothetical protein